MRRYDFVDTSRAAAVLFAMFSHALIHFASQVDALSQFHELRQFVTRTATPTFLFLFGAMIEIAYLRKLRETGDMTAMREKLIARGIVCYAIFGLICLAAFVSGSIGASQALGAMVYKDSGPLGSILRSYAFLFVMLAIFIRPLYRFGARFLVGLAIAGWGLRYGIEAFHPPHIFMAQNLFGYGSGYGPAAMLSWTFVAAGCLTAQSLLRGQNILLLVALVLGCVGLEEAGFVEYGLIGFVHELNTTARFSNQPVYYAHGLLAAGALLLLFYGLSRARPATSERFGLSMIGRSTLLVYGGGNVLLYLLPEYRGHGPIGYVFAVGFVALLIVWLRLRAPVFRVANALSLSGLARGRALFFATAMAVARRLARERGLGLARLASRSGRI